MKIFSASPVAIRLGLVGLAAACVVWTGCQQAASQEPPLDLAAAKKLRQQWLGSSDAEDSFEEEAVTGTGWATLTGTFKLDPSAAIRTPQALSVTEAHVCAPDGNVPVDQMFVVDPATHGIANIAIYVRDVSRVHESAQPNDEQVVFDQEHCLFLSHVLAMRVGQTLDIRNSDPIGHNTNIASGRGRPLNQLIPAGGSIDFKPTAEEPMPVSVSCNIHPWMKAYLLPRANGYFAVTKPDGSFEIPNLPAGEELEFQVWHEFSNGPGGGLAVPRPDLDWSDRGRFKIKLEEGENRALEIVVPGSSFNS